MKIHKAETVIRYHVSFDPHEAKAIDEHPVWRHVVHVRPPHESQPQNRYHRGSDAMLTKSQINEICDVLGINGRLRSHWGQQDDDPWRSPKVERTMRIVRV